MGPRSLLRRALALLAALLLLAALTGGTVLYVRMHRSLARLDGRAALAGLTAAVTIERDALGIPTIEGQSRLDVARALGFVHAQDRFFQMDLLRRRSAGELAELVGPAAVPADQAVRYHGFRGIARASLARAAPAERALAQAYADGVNAGLTALASPPFEYLVLRLPPAPWLPEDSALVGFSMTLDLEDDHGGYERSLATLRDVLGAKALAFFAPVVGPADAALDGSAAPAAPIPPVTDIDLHQAAENPDGLPGAPVTAVLPPGRADREYPGSNGFALAGAHAAGGAGLLAGDMHLRLSVPTLWYRARLRWPGLDASGVTLPGLPFVIAGSNGHIAWSFTNSFAATGDLVLVTPGVTPDVYHGPGGAILPFETRTDLIRVKGRPPVLVTARWTVWGPVVGTGFNDQPLAFHWVAHDPAAANLLLGEMEEATSVAGAFAVAHRAGMPAQNLIVADAAGAIGWTIAGFLPKRVGFDGRTPVSYLYGDRRWDGYLPPAEVPAVTSPADGRIWSANNRLVGGAELAKLGDAGYARGARALQLRDDLGALVQQNRPARPADLLAIQLDDRALFLERWHALLLQVLDPAALAGHPDRKKLRAIAETWAGRASTDSASYRLVRSFRQFAAARALDPIFSGCREAYPAFEWSTFHYEDALWTLLHEEPAHLLDARFATWHDLLLAAVDDTTADADAAPGGLRATWGRRNRTAIVHPFARLLPGWLTFWLNLPRVEVPGDNDMPRVQGPAFGASERFVVAPGREAEGIFELPGGESGNPLSPYYRAGFAAWATGAPTPFLPGAAAHHLGLAPQ